VVLVALLCALLVYKRYVDNNCTFDINRHWHVPPDALEDFGLSAFVFSRDYLYIENDRGVVIFDSPVECIVKKKNDCEYISISDGPPFVKKLLIEKSQDRDLDGFYLIGEDQELVAYIE